MDDTHLECPYCPQKFAISDVQLLEEHVSLHSVEPPCGGTMVVCEFCPTTSQPISGIVPLVRAICTPFPPKVSALFLSLPFDHYMSEYGVDSGWGCGYRNIMNLLSSLMPFAHYRRVIFDGSGRIPSIRTIQQYIQRAWLDGFDKEGAQQLEYSVEGTKKWIGTTECHTLLSYFGIRCEIVDFVGVKKDPDVMFDWVRDYFIRTEASGGFPLYCQHEGHSTTIFGYEDYTDGSRKLLRTDPGSKVDHIDRLSKNGVKAMKNLRHTMKRVKKKKEHQVLVVCGLHSTAEEREAAKGVIHAQLL